MIILTSKKIPESVLAYFDQTVFLPDNPKIESKVAFHTDLSVFSFGDTLICAPYLFEFLSRKIQNISVICGSESYSPYPYEIAYNAALVGNKLLCKTEYTCKIILEKCLERGITPVNVSQGYAKCSTVVVNDNSVITSDRSIQKATEKEGINALFVSNEGVFLDGYPNGFIGGASVVTDKEVIFIGNISCSPDVQKIIDFVETNGKKVVSFPEEKLYDIGSPIALF